MSIKECSKFNIVNQQFSGLVKIDTINEELKLIIFSKISLVLKLKAMTLMQAKFVNSTVSAFFWMQAYIDVPYWTQLATDAVHSFEQVLVCTIPCSNSLQPNSKFMF